MEKADQSEATDTGGSFKTHPIMHQTGSTNVSHVCGFMEMVLDLCEAPTLMHC